MLTRVLTLFLWATRAAEAKDSAVPATRAESVAQRVGGRTFLAKRTQMESMSENENASSCLCVFDIDRTLTGKQEKVGDCPGNNVIEGIYDKAYGSGFLTLSALAAEGINTTFCGSCYLAICSAGDAGGPDSDERNYLIDHVLRSAPQDALVAGFPAASEWSQCQNPNICDDVSSPLIVEQPNRLKQFAVEGIREWYSRQNVSIQPGEVYFFGDRTENMAPFAELGFNAQEVSCGSRDMSLYGGTEMVGYCGATPEEVTKVEGIVQCVPACHDTPDWRNGYRSCRSDGHGSWDGCFAAGWSCFGYQTRGWCANGRRTRGSDFAFGQYFNNPEKNCCVCGGGSVGEGEHACKPASIQRRRRNPANICACRRRSTSNGLPQGFACVDNLIKMNKSDP